MKSSNNRGKIFVTAVLAGSLLVGSPAYAESDEQLDVSAGTTPDSVFYTIDQLNERLQLSITSDDEKKADLLLAYAQERLSESNEMVQQGKDEYVNKLIDQYTETLSKAEDQIAKVVSSNDVSKETKQKFAEKLDRATDYNKDIEEKLDEKTQLMLKEKRIEAKVVASLIEGLDVESVRKMRESGFGFGEIVKIQAIAKASGKTVDEIASYAEQGKDFAAISQSVGLKSTDVLAKSLEEKEEKLEKALEEAEELGNKEMIEKLTNALERTERDKEEFK
ncbi:DUF5667 domain-containing protein [Allobacillus halotolerans]|uniref:DUF5667 domain-containing protein n=1 Tax=Allobacillus halotolerans TaxID=570278 RepID=A0ABS6GR96_9BACI|nr:DUF5667 domain-containing protein [Allobacillus halotolerans]MBU6081431.1 hypothetical protein [Allobacillus halotolerans]